MNPHNERALYEYLTEYRIQLEGISRFFIDIDWTAAHKISNEPSRQVLKMMIDKYFDEKVLGLCAGNPGIDCAALASNFQALAPDLHAQTDKLFEELGLTPLVPEQYSDADLKSSFEVDPAEKPIFPVKREHRPSLDLMQTRPSPQIIIQSHTGKPIEPSISTVNVIANSSAAAESKVQPAHCVSPESVEADGRQVSPQPGTVSPANPRSTALRRGSSVDANLPLYIRQQLSTSKVTVAKMPEPLKKPLDGTPIYSTLVEAGSEPADSEARVAVPEIAGTIDQVSKNTPLLNDFLISSKSLTVFVDESTEQSAMELRYTQQTSSSTDTVEYLSSENLDSTSLSRLGDSNGGPSNSDYSRY